MATPTPAPILEINTLVERPLVRIDGKTYEMRSRDEMAYLVYRAKAKQYQRLVELTQKKKRTGAENTELVKLVDTAIGDVLLAPVAVMRRLTFMHKVEVVTAFFQLLQTKAAAAVGAQTTRRSAGARASRTKTGAH